MAARYGKAGIGLAGVTFQRAGDHRPVRTGLRQSRPLASEIGLVDVSGGQVVVIVREVVVSRAVVEPVPTKNSIEHKNGPPLGRLEASGQIQFWPSDSPSFLGDRPEKCGF